VNGTGGPTSVRRPAWVLAALFLALWAFHLRSAGGAVVPYRDSGEMVVNAATLGVAHPPGYPAYVLAAKACTLLPLGGTAYRVNLLSAAAAALTGLVLFLAFAGAGSAAALLVTGLWAASPLFRELGAVSEMYTLGTLGAALLLWLVRRTAEPDDPTGDRRRWVAAAFVLGAFFGIRSELILFVPALLFLAARRGKGVPWAAAAAAFAAGLTVFLYLPLRSARQPWLDWNDPETLDRVLDSVLRRSHGGGLDLLARSYATGANLMPSLAAFARACVDAFTWAGVAAALWGVARGWKSDRTWTIFLLINIAVLGPGFQFLANMPPNPHAAAVLEAHFLLPLMMVGGLASLGAASLFAGAGRRGTAVGAVLAAGLVVFQADAHAARGSKRWELAARDYVTNVFRSARPGSAGVVREDVPLFAAWERAWVQGHRPDLLVVAQGLAASPWYQEMLQRRGEPGRSLAPLRDAEGWRALASSLSPRRLWWTGDADLPPEALPAEHRGLVSYAAAPGADAPAAATTDAWLDFLVLRGARRTTAAPDFFTSDLLAEYARAAFRHGSVALREGRADAADRDLRRAASFDPEAGAPLFHRAYALFRRGETRRAASLYSRAAAVYDDTLRKADEFNSLPALKDTLRGEAAEVWVHRGVVAEKDGDLEAARAFYARSVGLRPSAQAHFNWAVTYWQRDWRLAAEHLRAAATLDPADRRAAHYLVQAEAALAGGRP
jgi:tetratricopeptide (TPR) repeat protein